MPVISSDISAICSPVARSAASAAIAISNERRASNISAGVKRCSEAIKRNALLSSSGGPSASTTNVPAPRRGCNTPTAASELIPARNVGRLTPNSFARSLSGGSRSPGRSSPLWIISRSCATTSSDVVPRRSASIVLNTAFESLIVYSIAFSELSSSLLNQPKGKIVSGFVVIVFRRQFSPVRVLVIKPGIADGKNSALAKFGDGHDVIAALSKNRAGRRLHLESGNLLQVKTSRGFENRICGSHRKPAHRKIITGNFVPTVFIELNPKHSGQLIEVIEFRIPQIISHQHENTTRSDPFANRFHVVWFNEVRRWRLFFRIGIYDDVDGRIFQIRNRWRV